QDAPLDPINAGNSLLSLRHTGRLIYFVPPRILEVANMIRECRVPLRVLATLFMAIVGLAALSAAAVAQAGGSPGPGTSVGMWSFTSAAAMARAAGPAAAQVVVAPPRPGVMPGAAAITGE